MLHKDRRLTQWVMAALIVILIAAQLAGGGAVLASGALSRAANRSAACEWRAANKTIPFAPAGSAVHVPLVVAATLGVPVDQAAESVPPAVAQRVRRLVRTVLPCWPYAVSQVIVLRQPQVAPLQSSAQPMVGAKIGIMAGVTAVQKQALDRPYSAANMAINLYLFLPPELQDGSGLDTQLRSANIIPYAAAPVPKTYGDLLDWTVAHELWHVVDIQARLNHIRSATQGADAELDRILQDPALWAGEFQEIHVVDLLGWHDYGESFAQSDELSPPLRVTRGATTYVHVSGRFLVTYADGHFAFERQLVRAGSMPDAFEKLADLQALLKSGKYPTLYALLNTDEERFAEYGAWYLFAQLHAAGAQYAQISDTLATYYAQRWEAARVDLCARRR